eukprot:TRINITY_DN1184_c1_g1_i3.p1 TRINITY_DN1184_c1_g1~~TRINITY_DN1184_c1_g1_i3.p1  ORF type:complete len:1193 (+),score=204.74 TRINITY_DN1184_c1_g1_i3:83-3661(+)
MATEEELKQQIKDLQRRLKEVKAENTRIKNAENMELNKWYNRIQHAAKLEEEADKPENKVKQEKRRRKKITKIENDLAKYVRKKNNVIDRIRRVTKMFKSLTPEERADLIEDLEMEIAEKRLEELQRIENLRPVLINNDDEFKRKAREYHERNKNKNKATLKRSYGTYKAMDVITLEFSGPNFDDQHPIIVKELRGDVSGKIQELIDKGLMVKVSLFYKVATHKIQNEKRVEGGMDFSSTFRIENLAAVDFDNIVRSDMNRIREKEVQGSGWIIDHIKEMKITSLHAKALRGSAYVELPNKIKNKNAVINVNNSEDACNRFNTDYDEWKDKCFKLAIMSYERVTNKNLDKNASEIRKYKNFKSQFNFDDLEYPMKEKDIKKFIKNNTNVFIGLYKLDNEKVVPNGKFGDIEADNWIDILFYKDHYMWIKNLNSLLGKSGDHSSYCPNCLHKFTGNSKGVDAKDNMLKHFELCKNNKCSKVRMPKEGSAISFQNHYRKIKKPFVLYSDFESILVKQDNDTVSHKAASYAIYLDVDPSIGWSGQTMFTYEYIDGDISPEEYQKQTLKSFYNNLTTITQEIERFINGRLEQYKDINNIIMSKSQWAAHNASTKCCYCDRNFLKDVTGRKKVRDHCHLTGKFRGTACSGCNLTIRDKVLLGDIPLYFHNARGYDNNYIWQMLGISDIELFYTETDSKGKERDRDNVDVIKTNSETTMLIAFKCIDENDEYYEIRRRPRVCVKDSLQLLSLSLDTLLKNLPNDRKPRMRKHMKGLLEEAGAPVNDDNINLLLSKGVFPYSWFDHQKRLGCNSLPEKREWYDTLREEDITDEKYEKAKKIWNMLDMKTFKEYHDLYLFGDVLGLADVVNNFRDTLLDSHGLDPVYYVSLSSYSWDAMLLKTGVHLEQITDPDMYMFFEQQKRGGLTMAVQRHVKSNFPEMVDYDKEKDNQYLWYTDANNLYGWAMMKNLPEYNLQWVDDEGLKDLTEDFIRSYDVNSKEAVNTGFTIEVDLSYPEDLHKEHWDFPLAPYNRSVSYSELADYQKELIDEKKQGKHEKLICDFNDRRRQIYNIEYLKFLIDHGLKLEKVHRAVSYQQSDWLKRYIEVNSKLRQGAKNDFEKDLYKLLNNAVYGKTLENVRDRMRTKVVKNEERRRERVSHLQSIPRGMVTPFFSQRLKSIRCSPQRSHSGSRSVLHNLKP